MSILHESIGRLRALVLLLFVIVSHHLAGCSSRGVELADQPAPLQAARDTGLPSALQGYPPLALTGAAQSAQKGVFQWQQHLFPSKKATQYNAVEVDGRAALMATAISSASMLRQPVRVEPASLQTIAFSWKVAQLIPGADLSQRDAHDSPVRLVLAFEGDRSEFSMKNAMLSELSLTLTGEPMPYATLMYVWCNACAKEDVYVSPRTDRIREIALETGPERLGQWLSYQRDIQADYIKAYGQAPGALVGVGIMTDTDNTRQSAVAWYGPVSLTTRLSR